jgi:hypothetical protein
MCLELSLRLVKCEVCERGVSIFECREKGFFFWVGIVLVGTKK